MRNHIPALLSKRRLRPCHRSHYESVTPKMAFRAEPISVMPEEETLEQARKGKEEGTAPSTLIRP